jgi:DNA-binding response OmpR family regulator
VSRVLVVDDEDAIREAVAYVLRSDGNEVEVAAGHSTSWSST